MSFYSYLWLGTPKSLNLRNIVWHGFSSVIDAPNGSQETSIIFVSTIYILIRNLGKRIKILKENASPPFNIQWRSQHSLQRVDKIYQCFDSLYLENNIHNLEIFFVENSNGFGENCRLKWLSMKKHIVLVGYICSNIEFAKV